MSKRYILESLGSNEPKAMSYLVGLLILLILPSAAPHTDPQDVYALRILYESLRSPNLPGWNPNGGDPCGELWHGVECSGHNVVAIRLSNLRLRGSLGYALNKFTSLLTLDLSNNHIGETLPFQFPTRVVQLNLGNNVFIGTIPYSMKRLMSLTNLNLSTNFFSGDLPDIFEKLSNLQTLDISNNNFTGGLPDTFASLRSLSTLHMQQNELNGTLDLLTKLPLKDVNVENNNFTGSLPPVLRSLPLFRGGGNHFGSPPSVDSTRVPNGALPLQSPRPHHKALRQSGSEGSGPFAGGKLAGIISGAIVAALISTFLFFMLMKRTGHPTEKKNEPAPLPKLKLPSQVPVKEKLDDIFQLPSPDKQIRHLPIERYKPPVQKTSGHLVTIRGANVSITAAAYSYVELQAATANFSKHNLIGEGLLGRVYRGEFANGKIFAVKKLEMSREDDQLLTIISNISRLRHANIAELAGFCVENGQCLLVYPYFGTGTLHELLHLKNKTIKHLVWNQRMRIALGAARALEYLHEICSPMTVHRNFKSANILLDEDFNPHVSDSGLAALIPSFAEKQMSSQMLASFGYSAPEYGLSGMYTVKSDVYSFGVVMLELLTGREPLDSSKPRSQEQSLVAWAGPQLKDIDSLAKIVDPSMEGIYPAKALSKFAELISQCIQVEPESRPAMSEVVQSLVRLLQRGGMSKRTVSREMPLQAHQAQTPDRSSESSYEATFERSFERQNMTDSISLNL